MENEGKRDAKWSDVINCGTCIYGAHFGGYGMCKRYPPKRKKGDTLDDSFGFVVLPVWEWCGDWIDNDTGETFLEVRKKDDKEL